MDAKELIESRKPLMAYFCGPTGSGRFHNLVNFVTTLYQPGESQISQLQNIFSDYPQIVWFSGSRMLLDQNEKTVGTHAPQLLKYSRFEVYNLAKLNSFIKDFKNLIIVMDESCIKPQSGLIASRAKEMQTIVKLVNHAKVSLLVEGTQMPMGIKHSSQIGFRLENDKLVIEKNLLNPESAK